MPHPLRWVRVTLVYPLDVTAALLDDFAHRLLWATEALDALAAHVDPDAIPGYRFTNDDYELASQLIHRADREPQASAQ